MLAAWGFFDWTLRHWFAAIFFTYSSREVRLPVSPYLTPTLCVVMYVCVSLSVGQEKCASEKQPSKSDPWSSFATPHTSFPSVC